MRYAALLLIALGTGVAASFGSQNGPEMMQYRVSVLTAEQGSDEPVKTIPTPSNRLTGWWNTGGLGWLLGLAMVGGGGVMLRRAGGASEAASGSDEVSTLDFVATMDALVTEVRDIESTVGQLSLGATDEGSRERIDSLLQGPLANVVAGRSTWIQAHGFAGFSEYFGTFSGGERYVARAWTGLADGRPDVSSEALAQAAAAFASAKEAFQGVEGRAPLG